MEENVYLAEFHAKKQHNEQVVELDNKFHEMIYEACDSKILRHVMTDFHHYVQRIRMITLASRSRAEKSNEEHTAILNAIMERDADKAEKLANEHILNTIKNISDQGL